jgi:hypothetical protein
VTRQIVGHDIAESLEHLDLVAPIGQVDTDGMDQNDERCASFSRSNGMNAGAGLLRRNLCHVEIIRLRKIIDVR